MIALTKREGAHGYLSILALLVRNRFEPTVGHSKSAVTNRGPHVCIDLPSEKCCKCLGLPLEHHDLIFSHASRFGGVNLHGPGNHSKSSVGPCRQRLIAG